MNEFASIQLNKKSSTPVYRQLGEALSHLIADGVLQPHHKLPPIRKMANGLRINNDTVINAYKYLESIGAVYSVIGSGTYVSYPSEQDSTFALAAPRGKTGVNFADSGPSPELFPSKALKLSFGEALEREGAAAFSCSDSRGSEELRKAFSKRMSLDGIFTPHDYIQIISGTQNAADIISRWLSLGDCVFIEKPALMGMASVFESKGIQTVGVKSDSCGLSLKNLTELLKTFKPKLLCTAANFRQPASAGCTADGKKLLDLAYAYKFQILEDDSFGDFVPLKEKTPAIKAMDRRNAVIYVKTFNRLAGIKLGFMTLPSKRQGPKATSFIQASGITQKAFSIFYQNEAFDEFASKMRLALSERLEDALAAADAYLSDETDIARSLSGACLWIRFRALANPDALYNRLLQRNVIVIPGSVYSLDNAWMCLYLSGVEKGRIVEGIRIIAEEVKRLGTLS
ncbi:MAG: PLP-dependent aminotransferase family protein [Clostridiales bacterium]|jgi:DNA-binding transcriptional MocR family regulator|nr:PLP-dependent aminotransferase family protein [Clostridiales bacterium]